MGSKPVGEIGELEMSCQRCGGVLGTELAASMYELVCGKGVIENRYCHCDDVQSPVQAYQPREEESALARESPGTIISEGGDTKIGYGRCVLVGDDDERSGAFVIGNVAAKEEQIMGTENADAEEAVLSMLQQYEGLMMEDLIAERPDFSWAQLFLAIDRLSRKNLITLHRVGLSYQLFLKNEAWIFGQVQHQ
jgi:hypothetical protein